MTQNENRESCSLILPRHYFRYCLLFLKAKYNLTATTTKLPPEEDDRVQDCKRQTHHLRCV